MKQLDTLDRRILFELDRNSRQTMSDLARKIREGRDKVEYRVERMNDQKIIRKFVTSVNPYKLGFTLFKTYLRLENRKDRIAEFLLYLQNHPRIYWLALCDGGWDLIVILFARHPHEFHEMYTRILSEFNDVVLNFTVHTLVDYTAYTRKYLVKAAGGQTLVGGPPETIPLDKQDYEILRLLAKDSRLPALTIGERAGLTHQVVRYRIERMQRLGIINGYRIELDLAQLGILFFKTQFYLRNYELSLRQRLMKYCDSNPHIVSYIEQVGDCNVEIELEVNDYEQYAEIIDEIRGEYSKLVRNFQSVLIRKSNRYPVPEDMSELVIGGAPL